MSVRTASLPKPFHDAVVRWRETYLPDYDLLLDRVMELIAQFTHEVDTQHVARHMADTDGLAREPREGFVREISACQFLQQLARIRTGDDQHAKPCGDRVEAH